VLDVYLYIVVSPPVMGFPTYLHTCTCIYMWPLAPVEYNLYIPNKTQPKDYLYDVYTRVVSLEYTFMSFGLTNTSALFLQHMCPSSWSI
jgi:hypothetical protein